MDKPNFDEPNAMHRVADRLQSLERELGRLSDSLANSPVDKPLREVIMALLLISKELRRVAEWNS
jgi:hypothetical protein